MLPCLSEIGCCEKQEGWTIYLPYCPKNNVKALTVVVRALPFTVSAAPKAGILPKKERRGNMKKNLYKKRSADASF